MLLFRSTKQTQTQQQINTQIKGDYTMKKSTADYVNNLIKGHANDDFLVSEEIHFKNKQGKTAKVQLLVHYVDIETEDEKLDATHKELVEFLQEGDYDLDEAFC
jgi:hypothetical protein